MLGFPAASGAADGKGEDHDMSSPFGVLEFLQWNHPWNHYKYPSRQELDKALRLMQEAGIGWVRFDFLWEDIESSPGNFDFAKYDLIVELASEYKINILGILDYTASWASPQGVWNYPAQDPRPFVNYASKVIERYKGKIKYWELWNEPDSGIYWQPQDGLKSYCALLKEVYLAAKKIDPGCKILNGGLANGLSSVNRLYDNGAKGYFDILNIHIFENPLNPGSIKAVEAYPRLAYKVISRNGDGDKEIWVTEIGCPGVKSGFRVKNWWMGKNPTESLQADWLKNIFGVLLKDKRVKKVFWAFFRDCDKHWDNGIDYFGVVRWDFSRKPAFKALQEAAN